MLPGPRLTAQGAAFFMDASYKLMVCDPSCFVRHLGTGSQLPTKSRPELLPGGHFFQIRGRLMVWLAVLAFALAADDVSPDLQRLKDDAAEQRVLLLKQLKSTIAVRQQMLRRARSGVIDPKSIKNVYFPETIRVPVVFKSKDFKTRWLKMFSAALDQAKKDFPKFEDGTLPLIPYLRSPLEAGQVGLVENATVEVTQVIDGETMLAEMQFCDSDGDLLKERLVYISGVSTDGVTDDIRVILDDESIFQIDGTKRDGTAIGGSNTVLSMKMLDKAELAALRKRLLEK